MKYSIFMSVMFLLSLTVSGFTLPSSLLEKIADSGSLKIADKRVQQKMNSVRQYGDEKGINQLVSYLYNIGKK